MTERPPERDDADARVLERLFTVIASRHGGDPEASYTARLFHKGRVKIARKVGEEAVEVVVAAVSEGGEGGPQRICAESADLLYHLLVLWAETGVAPEDVWRELGNREGISGIAEKAARNTD